MIGLVVGKQAVEQVAGVTPLSPWTVRRIKASMLVRGNLGFVALYALLLGTAIAGAVLAVVMHKPWLFSVTLGAMSAFLGIVRDAQRSATLTSYWADAQYCEPVYQYRGGYRWMWFGHWAAGEMPEHVSQIADNVKALGLEPKVEYFETDPFLFVEVGGKRVYLCHWE